MIATISIFNKDKRAAIFDQVSQETAIFSQLIYSLFVGGHIIKRRYPQIADRVHDNFHVALAAILAGHHILAQGR